MPSIEVLNSHPVSVLKKEISKTNIKGYSKMKKKDIIALMMKDIHKDKFEHIKMAENKTVKQQSKKALQNEVQSIMRDILSHPKSFDQLITPVGASTLKDEAKVIAMKRNPNAFDLKGNKIPLSLSQTLKLESMINTSYRMFSGLGGIGIVATSSTQHSKGQRPGVNWNFANHLQLDYPLWLKYPLEKHSSLKL